jgi:hypothetical protein
MAVGWARSRRGYSATCVPGACTREDGDSANGAVVLHDARRVDACVGCVVERRRAAEVRKASTTQRARAGRGVFAKKRRNLQ